MQTVIGSGSFARTFRPGDKIEVKELHGNSYLSVTVDVFTEPTYLVVKDVGGNTWCVHDVNNVK